LRLTSEEKRDVEAFVGALVDTALVRSTR